MIPKADWQTVNRRLIAKSLQELVYEQVLQPRLLKKMDANKGHYQVTLVSGIVYEFTAWRSLWTDLRTDPNSILRNGELATSAAQFFIDSQKETLMDDITLGNFLEEMHNTLHADLALLAKNKSLHAEELACWTGERIQSILNGHPKLLLNKGRVGWDSEDLINYAPENERPLQLLWLAVHKSVAVTGFASELQIEELLNESFNKEELERFHEVLKQIHISFADYVYVPTHPWQWQRYIQIQFAGELAQGNIHFLGAFGDLYLPQISLRTFTNISRPAKMDIKLPLTILNTSSIRGLTGKYITQGASLSADFTRLCQQDKTLSAVQILEEKAGIFMNHPHFSQVTAAPYRYHEYLGAIWRTSASSLLSSSEKAILTSSLFHQDSLGHSLIGAYVKASGLSISEWLKLYFDKVVIPLYHLQVVHGVGLVAHGQNIMLRLKNNRPEGLILKDFQGDLRLSDSSQALNYNLTRLPPHYLIHDLITGHFVTVLRFISQTLSESDHFPEKDFYRVLGVCLENYLATQPAVRGTALDLLQEKFARVLVNRVRFKIGYADSAERPLPILGEDLFNPIYSSLKNTEVPYGHTL